MAANFPDSPSTNDTFTSNGLTFTWNRSAWKLDPSSGTKGGAGRTASKASRSRTGRSRSQCDIRTKIDIAQLTNTDLFRDDLADVAYFVKEIK